MTSQSAAQDLEDFLKIPPGPHRTEALNRSGLVRKWEDGDLKDGLLVLNGEISPSSSDGWKTAFPEYLLDAEDEDLATEAWQVLFSQNRILLERDLKASLNFLESHVASVKHIRSLDILFDEDIIHEWTDHKADWKNLAELIAAQLDLQQLDLSLDAGPTYQTYQEWDSTESTLEEVKPVYREIVQILKDALQGKQPKTFSVYWVVFSSTEIEAEKAIMGQEYDSQKIGKVPSNKRSPHFPHGAPRPELEFTNGIQL